MYNFIILFAVVCGFYNVQATTTATDCTQRFLGSLVPGLRVELNGDQFKLGHDDPAVLTSLSENLPSVLAGALHAPGAGGVCLGTGPIKDYKDFLERLGLTEVPSYAPEQDGNVFRCLSKCGKDLLASSPFFRWARENIQGFATEVNGVLQVSYKMLEPFLTYTPTAVDEDGSLKLSRESLIRLIIAQNSGNVTLRQLDPTSGKYEVIILQELAMRPQDLHVQFYLDVSASMDGEPIQQLKILLPQILRSLRENLPDGVTAHVTLTPYENHLLSSHELGHFTNKDRTDFALNTFISGLNADGGGTNILTPLEDGLTRPKGQVGFTFNITDVCHNGTPNTTRIEQLVRDENSCFTLLVGVGAQINQNMLQTFTTAMGGSCETAQTVSGCEDTIRRRMPTLATPHELWRLFFAGLSHQDVRVPMVPGIYSAGEAAAGDEIANQRTGGQRKKINPTKIKDLQDAVKALQLQLELARFQLEMEDIERKLNQAQSQKTTGSALGGDHPPAEEPAANRHVDPAVAVTTAPAPGMNPDAKPFTPSWFKPKK